MPPPEARSPDAQDALWDARLRHLFDATLDAVIAMDSNGRIMEWNRQAELIFGWPRRLAVGHDLAELIIPQRYRDMHRSGLDRFRQTKDGPALNLRVEMIAVTRDGSEFPIELAIAPVDDGVTRYFTAFARDITVRRRAEERETREMMISRLMQHISSLMLDTASFEDSLQTSLELLCEITDWPVGHIYVPDDDGRLLIPTDTWRLSDPERYAALHEVTMKSRFGMGEGLPGRVWEQGDPLWLEDVERDAEFPTSPRGRGLGVKAAFAFPVKLGTETLAIMEFFTDRQVPTDPQLLFMVRNIGRELGRLVERRRWEAERLRLAAIVDSSYDAIIAKTSEGIITSWNAGAELVYGYSEYEAVGQPISIIIPGDNDEDSQMREALRLGKRVTQFETRRRRKDGRVIDVAITVSPIVGSDGSILGTSTIERDISQTKRRELELQQAIAAAEEANRAKSEFLANVSHELRTPMNAIIGMLQLALGEQLSESMREYLETANDAAHTLLTLLNDILDFSRMEAGRFQLESVPFSIRHALDRTMKTLALRAAEKGLELACHVHTDVPDAVVGDNHRLRQIVLNLVGNAIKFTPQGEVLVDVSKQEVIEDELLVHVTVSDTGIGISPEDQQKIFTPFTQADASTTRQYPGTGLGLAICQELVTRMHGRMWVESELGRGSTFHFTARLGSAPETAASESEQRATKSLRNLPVLVVDDNASNRRILSEMLSNWKMKPSAVDSAPLALDELRKAAKSGEQYPLVIVDALMPEMDGFQLVERAARERILAASTILMLSSADRQTFDDRCAELPVRAFLEKPVSQSDLLDAIVTALQREAINQPKLKFVRRSVSPLRILVAEDTPANQKVVNAILSKRGHHVVTAHNGREAFDLVEELDFDVVLMDVQMPTMDGIQATAAIRELEDPEKSTIPIVAMTAHAMQGDREKCLAAGMDNYLSKPIDAEALISVVERIGRKARFGRTSAINTRSYSSQESIIVDKAGALKRLGGDEGLLRDLIEYFQSDAPELLQQIQCGLNDCNREQVRRAAHSLKGLSANFGAKEAVEAAKRVEERVQDRGLSDVQPLVVELEKSIHRLQDALRNLE